MKRFSQILFNFFVATLCFVSFGELHAYTKKAPYEGYGKISKKTGKPKTKIVKGHVKKTKNGYTQVNPYAKSQKK
jgi:hypothetical protein